MANKAVFMTGAGGFLGRYILERYLDEQECGLYLLENGRFCERLRGFLEEHIPDPAKRARAQIVEGDITQPGLGLTPVLLKELRANVTHAIHLAALYDLTAPRDVSVRVNVDGTRNVLDFLETCPKLERFGHTSTLAVAGDYLGEFSEDDFDKGQSFKNYYEETKFLAEKLVRERRDKIPTVILRPAAVVGHSKTGAIDKIDGPYYLLTTIARNLHIVLPDCGPARCHIAPVDFVTDGFYSLFDKEDDAVGRVFFLMDPNPLTYNDMFDLLCEHMGKFKALVRIPPAWMKPVAQLKIFEWATGIPWKAFMYGAQPIEYNIEKSTAALAKHGVVCPPLASYIDVMIRYFREHRHDPRVRRGNWRK